VSEEPAAFIMTSIDTKGIGCEFVQWIDLFPDKVILLPLMNTIIKFRIRIVAGN
jgi:hypothetical protein